MCGTSSSYIEGNQETKVFHYSSFITIDVISVFSPYSFPNL